MSDGQVINLLKVLSFKVMDMKLSLNYDGTTTPKKIMSSFFMNKIFIIESVFTQQDSLTENST